MAKKEVINVAEEHDGNKNKKEKGETVMSTVFFFEGSLPKTINLKDCGFPLTKPIDDSFPALYGHIGKQAGFIAAKEYADKHRLQFTIIDFTIKFDTPVDTVPVKLEELHNVEIVSLKRLPRNEIVQLYDKYINDEQQHELKDNKKAYIKMVENPELLSSVINHDDFKDLKLMIYPAKTAISDNPLTIGTIPNRHWDVITSAVCRLHPNTQVSLEPPGKADQRQTNEQKDQDHVKVALLHK
ncbi:hypothetical protein L292_1667 [Acinetobacter junii CIP 107470 = MTCC 11364]|uniref:Uncharacterized protein n=1 Tax=Acinetobacter junii CIP 107470 = MTCC 11364 TaxID=1217666 RepID=S7WEZ7_ACIJU|nr:hypothetical protein [Acinetobacter junii]ENV52065.1 hypothetical protein F953_00477 [Acinetobacter junii CIP 107470 = MTCC 11364]EPR80342.1 hypothetical protein L292_1667 [Acinetobacter junii CIP 107470 = MTCC 11364]